MGCSASVGADADAQSQPLLTTVGPDQPKPGQTASGLDVQPITQLNGMDIVESFKVERTGSAAGSQVSANHSAKHPSVSDRRRDPKLCAKDKPVSAISECKAPDDQQAQATRSIIAGADSDSVSGSRSGFGSQTSQDDHLQEDSLLGSRKAISHKELNPRDAKAQAQVQVPAQPPSQAQARAQVQVQARAQAPSQVPATSTMRHPSPVMMSSPAARQLMMAQQSKKAQAVSKPQPRKPDPDSDDSETEKLARGILEDTRELAVDQKSAPTPGKEDRSGRGTRVRRGHKDKATASSRKKDKSRRKKPERDAVDPHASDDEHKHRQRQKEREREVRGRSRRPPQASGGKRQGKRRSRGRSRGSASEDSGSDSASTSDPDSETDSGRESRSRSRSPVAATSSSAHTHTRARASKHRTRSGSGAESRETADSNSSTAGRTPVKSAKDRDHELSRSARAGLSLARPLLAPSPWVAMGAQLPKMAPARPPIAGSQAQAQTQTQSQSGSLKTLRPLPALMHFDPDKFRKANNAAAIPGMRTGAGLVATGTDSSRVDSAGLVASPPVIWQPPVGVGSANAVWTSRDKETRPGLDAGVSSVLVGNSLDDDTLLDTILAEGNHDDMEVVL